MPSGQCGERPRAAAVAPHDEHDDHRVGAREVPPPQAGADAAASRPRHRRRRAAAEQNRWLACQPSSAFAVAASLRVARASSPSPQRAARRSVPPPSPGGAVRRGRRRRRPSRRACPGRPARDVRGEPDRAPSRPRSSRGLRGVHEQRVTGRPHARAPASPVDRHGLPRHTGRSPRAGSCSTRQRLGVAAQLGRPVQPEPPNVTVAAWRMPVPCRFRPFHDRPVTPSHGRCQAISPMLHINRRCVGCEGEPERDSADSAPYRLSPRTLDPPQSPRLPAQCRGTV